MSSLRDFYHFHKDCKYYPQCTEELVKNGKKELVKFTCPMLKYPITYYKNDIHKIKWDCGHFEPYQNEMFGGSSADEQNH